jgi:hypothetical protein
MHQKYTRSFCWSALSISKLVTSLRPKVYYTFWRVEKLPLQTPFGCSFSGMNFVGPQFLALDFCGFSTLSQTQKQTVEGGLGLSS